MSRVRHRTHGLGTLIAIRGNVATVEFDAGAILKVASEDLKDVASGGDALERAIWDPPLGTSLKALALSIRSTNERWGVFSRSRVALLPHQLWVCHRVLSRWPSRWLVADDVGLGKTIEAGLILTPLLARGLVQRLLVVCPASLVDQWVERLRNMFDIRASRYHPEVDRPGDDFWQVHRQVVASMHTLRADRNDRWERIFQADPWDLVLVDEAHHLNADEKTGRTLGLQLVEEMEEKGLVRGLLLFTGTPHRGKDFGFLSLLRLLREDVDPAAPMSRVLSNLPEMMIRNNKQNVTNMRGERLFKTPAVTDVVYSYSPEEARFYLKLTEFILTGRAYASTTHLRSQRSVMLVLITLQKLAASSVAAVRRALSGRLARLRQQLEKRPEAQEEIDRIWRKLAAGAEAGEGDEDQRAAWEERIDELMETTQLNPDEIPALEELVELAKAVTSESRIERLMALLAELAGEPSVLFFTEYKATQALVVTALAGKYGPQSVGFINGDGFLDGVVMPDRSSRRLTSDRKEVAEAFNSGHIRFLVSTEAAGEGIDLQARCHTLVHVDLPWNPMRMHQRVGRLNRYGQTEAVSVYLLRNPNTVEGRIWERLEEKLQRIGRAFEGAMADPEDIRALVLGLATPGFHEQMAARALGVSRESFDRWYDVETSSIEGEDVVSVVRALLGNTARFDFASDAAGLPRVDLQDLGPFLRGALRFRGRRIEDKEDGTFTFKTPDDWMKVHHAIRDRYHGHLDRGRPDTRGGPTMFGAGHRLIEAALSDLADLDCVCASVDGLGAPVWLFMCQDALSAPDRPLQRIVVGVVAEATPRVVVDWELVLFLNPLMVRPDRAGMRGEHSSQVLGASAGLEAARQAVMDALPSLDLPFSAPEVRLEVLLWPAAGADVPAAEAVSAP
jgi:superfamily II DNA or RNA helicase